MNLYERVSYLAKKQNISIPQLSEKLGFSTQYLYKWKTNVPKADNLQKVADYFNVSTDYLLGRTNNPAIDGNDSEDEFATFFRINTEDMPQEDKEKLQEELKEYFEFMKNRLKNK